MILVVMVTYKVDNVCRRYTEAVHVCCMSLRLEDTVSSHSLHIILNLLPNLPINAGVLFWFDL